jgi:hypothetical protein
MERQPFGLGAMFNALDFYLRKPQEIVVVGDPDAADTQTLLQTIHAYYLPNRILVQLDPQRLDADLDTLPLLREIMAGKTQVEGKATVYVCHNFACSLPMTTADELARYLAAIGGADGN